MFKQLGDIYESINEEFRGLGRDQSPSVKGMSSTYSNPKLSIRNNKLGTQVADMAAASQAGLVPFGNPYEQEETSETVQKSDVLKLIDFIGNELGESSTDRVAILALSKLKQKIQKL